MQTFTHSTKCLLILCGLAGLARAATITPYPGFPSPQPGLNAGNDAFYYTNTTISNSSTGIVSNCPVVNYTACTAGLYQDLLGNTQTLGNPDGAPYNDIIFNSDLSPGFSNTVFFTTNSSVTLRGYNLILSDAGPGSIYTAQTRGTTQFMLFAGGNLISNVSIVPAGGNYTTTYGNNQIQVSDTFAPVTATSFEAVFVNNNEGRYSGARVFDLQGIPVGTASTPEPGTVGLFGAGIAAFAFCRKRLA